MDVDLWELKPPKSVTLLDPRGSWTSFDYGVPEPLEGGHGVLFLFSFIRTCHLVGAHYLVLKFAASYLIQQRSLASESLCGNVTVLPWPGERHGIICSPERSSFRVGGRAGCRLALGEYLQACGHRMLWLQTLQRNGAILSIDIELI